MKLSDLCGPGSVPPECGQTPVTGLTADSRAVRPGFLFAALSGVHLDGARFIADAVERGAAAILTGDQTPVDVEARIPVIRDANPRRRLALMAARFYGRQPETAVAVTGTNGKTSVASFLRQIWESCGHSAASLGTTGIHFQEQDWPLAHTTPDPVSLHASLAELADRGATHLAFEASSHGLAQYRADGIELAAGAFTNISRDHLDYHPDFTDYFSAKMRLFTELLRPGQPASRFRLGPIFPDHQTALDILLRVGGVRLQRHSPRNFLSSHRNLGMSEMGAAIHLDRHERHHHLSDRPLRETGTDREMSGRW